MGKKIAIWSFVLSLLFFIPFSPLAGIIVGIISLAKRDKKDPSYVLGLSIAAIVIGFMMIFISAAFFAILGAKFIEYTNSVSP